MSVDVVQFPLTMAQLAGGPMFNTDVTVGKSGTESRNANWQDGLWKFNAGYSVKTRADVHTLNTFFLNRRGREKAFLLQSYEDYKIPHSGSTAQSIGTGDGSTSTFQIYKRYTDSGSNNYDRIITRPSATTSDLVVIKNGVTQTHTTHYTYSTTTGIITFVTPPTNGHAITITLAKFYVPVRFDIDELPIEMLMHYVSSGADVSHHQPPSIPMIEVRD